MEKHWGGADNRAETCTRAAVADFWHSPAVAVAAGSSKLFSPKRCWQVRANTWGTGDLGQPAYGKTVPQLLPELSGRTTFLQRDISTLRLSSPAWGAPECVQVCQPRSDLLAQPQPALADDSGMPGCCCSVTHTLVHMWSTSGIRPSGSAAAHVESHGMHAVPCCGPPPLLSNSHQSGHKQPEPAAVQTVDLLALLLQRGLRPSAAAAWLDSSPPIAVSVWIRSGGTHRGASMEGTAVVTLDNGRDKGLAIQEGVCLAPALAGSFKWEKQLRELPWWELFLLAAAQSVPVRPFTGNWLCVLMFCGVQQHHRAALQWPSQEPGRGTRVLAAHMTRLGLPSSQAKYGPCRTDRGTGPRGCKGPATASDNGFMCTTLSLLQPARNGAAGPSAAAPGWASSLCRLGLLLLTVTAASSQARQLTTHALPPGWEGVRQGNQIQPSTAIGYWISWAPDDSLLRGCHRQPTTRTHTSRGTFRRVSTVFSGYRKVRGPAWGYVADESAVAYDMGCESLRTCSGSRQPQHVWLRMSECSCCCSCAVHSIRLYRLLGAQSSL